MLFSSPIFLFVFLPAILAAYGLAGPRWRNGVLLLGSVLFYAWGEPVAVFVVLASAMLDYALAPLVVRPGRPGRAWLALGVAANLGLLIFYKYTNFILANLRWVVGPAAHLNVVLPIGVSFIVFEKITYLVDLRRGVGRPAASLKNYLMFVFLFPKILAGPIVKYHDIERYLGARAVSWEDRTWGFLRFLWGLARKVLIADVCGEVVDKVFALAPGQMGFSTAWLAVVAFTVQIYFDFAGYSDMAIGLARMFGFRIPENFNNPYIARSFTEFWRRWHISLTTWIREYLYIPLGGNRHGPIRTYLNLWVCFILSGLWHGAAWTFVIWGAWNGLFLVLDRLFWERISRNLPRALCVAPNLLLIMMGWAIFRSHGLDQMTEALGAMVRPGQPSPFVRVQAHQLLAIAVGLAGALAVATPPAARLRHAVWTSPAGRAATAVAVALLGLVAVEKTIASAFHPFLYFRF